jgi:hypothetical protein
MNAPSSGLFGSHGSNHHLKAVHASAMKKPLKEMAVNK